MLERTPLPAQDQAGFDSQQDDLTIQSAYNLVLNAQRWAENDDDLLHVRVVGWFMIYLYRHSGALSFVPITHLAREITTSTRLYVTPPHIQSDYDSNKVILALGRHYRHLIRAFRKKGPLPQISHHPSRPSFDSQKKLIEEYLKGSGSEYKSVKQKALVRDGFRCLATGRLDARVFHANPRLFDQDTLMTHTECCHILSQSTLQNTGKEPNKGYASSVLAILESFGLGDVVGKFIEANGIHDLSNVLTLSIEVYRAFDELHVWFEKTDTPNEYRTCAVFKGAWQVPATVVFRDASNNPLEPLALPDPRLLTLHAVCAKVAHMSGAAQEMDRIDREAEEILVLASDGSSASLLFERLVPFAVVTY